MRCSHNIWIPSLQSNLRFKDMSFEQYRCIIKILEDDDLEFISTLNEIMLENITSKFDIDQLTTLDRFIIFLGLKINSCGKTISLSKKCDKCDKVTNVKMDLNQLVDNIAPNIDRKFTALLNYQNFSAVCDIPTIKNEHEIYIFNNLHNIDMHSLDFNLNNYIFSHISEIIVNQQVLNMQQLEYKDRLIILNKLPTGLIHEIQSIFLKDIHSSVLDIDFLKINCKDCNESFEIKFDITNINDILKIIYKDESVENMLHTILNVCIHGHLGSYIESLSPMDVNSINKILQNANKKREDDAPPVNPQDSDLFSQYRKETAHMQETPSDF